MFWFSIIKIVQSVIFGQQGYFKSSTLRRKSDTDYRCSLNKRGLEKSLRYREVSDISQNTGDLSGI